MALSLRAYARHRGMSEGAVRVAIKTGRITKNDDGKIDPVVADEQWAINSDPARSKPIAQDERGEQDQTSLSAQARYQQSRAVHEGYNARMAKLEFEKASGKLISLEQADADLMEAAIITRDRMMAIPMHLAPQLVGKTDLMEIRALLNEAVVNALNELVDQHGSQSTQGD